MKTSVNFFKLGSKQENATNEEMDRKEEYEHSHNDVSYHPVDKQCRKNSQEPTSSVERRAISRSHEETSSTTRTTKKQKILVPIHSVQSIIVQVILITIQIVKTIQYYDTIGY